MIDSGDHTIFVDALIISSGTYSEPFKLWCGPQLKICYDANAVQLERSNIPEEKTVLAHFVTELLAPPDDKHWMPQPPRSLQPMHWFPGGSVEWGPSIRVSASGIVVGGVTCIEAVRP